MKLSGSFLALKYFISSAFEYMLFLHVLQRMRCSFPCCYTSIALCQKNTAGFRYFSKGRDVSMSYSIM